MVLELILAAITSFLISMFFWLLVKLYFFPIKLITRPREQVFRSRLELAYVVKRELREFRRWVVIVITIISAVIVSSYLQIYQQSQDYTNHVYTATIAIIIAVIVYDVTRASNEKQEIMIRRTYGNLLLSSDVVKGKSYSINKISLTLENILYYIKELKIEGKKWIKENDKNKKQIIKGRCIENVRCINENGKVLDNLDIVSNKFFESDVIEMVNKISVNCKKSVEFDESKNEFAHEGLDPIILYSLLVLDKFKIITRYRYMI